MGSFKDFKLTTVDNPYSPFEDFEAWLAEDLAMGYDTLGLIARLSVPPGDYDPDYEYSVSARIVELNLSGSHVMVTKEDYINGVLQKFDAV